MTFLENIFARLDHAARAPVLREVREGKVVSATGDELLAMVGQARDFLRSRGLKKGDRCALHAANSIRWAAIDLAMMAEGLIVVPLYARQAPHELAVVLKDSTPSHMICADSESEAEIRRQWPEAPEITLLENAFAGRDAPVSLPYHHADNDPLAIVYTSGTSGEPKGVVLNAGNVGHALRCTNARLDKLMSRIAVSATHGPGFSSTAGSQPKREPDRVFHYLPFCFAASWISLLTFLSRNSVTTLSTDLGKLSDELKIAEPNYFVNVPTLLERIRGKVEESIRARGGLPARIFFRAQQGCLRRQRKKSRMLDSLYLSIAESMIFPTIRKSLGPKLRALICGSAPLSVETQLFFVMLGLPVLQVYGLTETTGPCTMDDPENYEVGRVGSAIPGVEMRVGEDGEILARGPNIFPGYWQRPADTARALEGGWFHTGDQGEVSPNGNWRITGRLKNLIILNSGHNIAPEPIEEELARLLPDAKQVVLVGNQRSFLAALITFAGSNGSSNGTDRQRIQAIIDDINEASPHYKQIRAFHIVPEPFTLDNGLLTTMGKLKRDAISARFAAEIERLYQKKPE